MIYLLFSKYLLFLNVVMDFRGQYYEDLRFNRLISNNRYFPYREEKIYNYPFLVLTDKDGKTSTNILIRLSGEFKIFLSGKILTIQVLHRIFN